MKFFVPLFAAGVLASVATPVERQNPAKRQSGDLATVSNALQSIVDAENSLATQVSSFSGESDIAPLQSAVSQLQSIISSGTDAINGISTLSGGDAAQLFPLSQALETGADTATTNAINVGDAISAACAAPAAVTIFQSLQDPARGLAAALRTKVPTTLQQVVDDTVNSILASLSRGEQYFQQNGNAASCSGGTGGGDSSSSSTPAPTGSTPPETTGTLPVTTGTAPITTGTATVTPPSYGTGPATTSRPAATTGPIAVYPGAAAPGAIINAGAIVLAAAAVLL